MPKTETEYSEILAQCFELFSKKNQDYGTSWRILRLPSITDQLYIKAKRIRTIQENGFSRINEGQVPEFIGLINYCIMALMLISKADIADDDIVSEYNNVVDEVKTLHFDKNHDYNEAWRNMRVSSMTDIILMKLLRIKQIENNSGKTLVSEGVKSGYQDIINYSVFCLIKLSNEKIQTEQQ